MIDPKELAEALKGCKIDLRHLLTHQDGHNVFEITKVTPPPKKPEEEWLPVIVDPNYMSAPWRTERKMLNGVPDPGIWLRREVIDGVPQKPIVVMGKAP